MKDREDAVGHHLYDFLHGLGGFEVVERDDGKILGAHDPAIYFSRFPDWPAHEQEAIRSVRGRVLDVGCGAGRHALHLQEAGLDVVAIDASPLAIAVCRERGVKVARQMPLTRVGTGLGMFQTIVMLDGNWGLLGNHDRARRLLRRLFRMTDHDGQIVADSYDPSVQTDEADAAYARANLRRRRMPGQYRLRVRYKAYRTPWFDYLFVSKHEMEKILGGTGWVVRRFLDAGDRRYAAIIRKEAVETR